MATNTITFGGVVLPCTVERFPDIKKAQRKFRQYNVPGRNGDIFFQDDAWENVIQTYQVYAGGDQDGQAQVDWTDLAKKLSLKGYQILEDTYDADHFRKAVFNGPLDIENAWNTHGRATIEFNCRPERYLKEGREPIIFASGASLNIRIVAYEDLSAYVQQELDALGLSRGPYFVFDYPSQTDQYEDLFAVQNAPRVEAANAGLCVPVGTEGTASSGAVRVKMNRGGASYGPEFTRADYQNFTGTSVIIQQTLTSGETPVFYFNFSSSPHYRRFETHAVVTNDYMPAFPSIVLHNVAAYSGEVAACQIGSSSIWVTYDAGAPYYFVDVENFSVTKAAALDAVRELANNVRIDPGIRLEEGENEVFASAYYDLEIVPNFWEL